MDMQRTRVKAKSLFTKVHKYSGAWNIMKTKGEKLAQKLGNMPPNILTPNNYLDRLVDLDLFNSKLLESEDSVGSIAVSAGSHPADEGFVYEINTKTKGTVLVGKGITFDTGGYSLKGDAHMVGMKYDMMGSAVVLGAMIDLDNKHHVTAELCISENRVGPNAIVPDSVLFYPDGTKVIVEDTDAEGRLVLADGILRARTLKAKTIVTVATLTGAIVSALGNNHVGVFVTSDKLAEQALLAFKGTGLNGWRMPFLEEESKKAMKRPGGAITNLNHKHRMPGHSYAASFLKHFARNTPFIHLDMAGVGDDDNGARIEMVKVLVNLVKILDK